MSISRVQVLNAFQPAKEITDPRKFSGRKDQIERGTDLLISGDHAFIYGARGIGKSSIARQLKIIAEGNPQLLKALESSHSEEHLDYATCYIARDASINNLNQLLNRVLIDGECFGKFPYIFEEFGSPPSTYSQDINLDPALVSDFWQRAQRIAKNHKNGLAIFVDEFELIEHHDGFASFLKAGKDRVIFIITGIGNTEKELVRDHRSIDRQLATGKIPLPPMSGDELLKVIDTAEQSINREICFTEASKRSLVETVKGQPFLLHLIGRDSFITAFNKKRSLVDDELLKIALTTVAKEQVSAELEERYLSAIRNSPQRETVLRAFAEICEPIGHTSDAYRLAIAKGVTNPSIYTGNLQKASYGGELRKEADQFYSFKDRLFQAYVVATTPRLGRSVEPTSDETVEKVAAGNTDTIELLHFSDIHFGDHHYFSKIPIANDTVPEVDKPNFANTIISAIERENLTPSAIVISGDLTQTGTTQEFNLAAAAVNSILNYFRDNEKPTPTLITCPGNHDVNWSIQSADPHAKHLPFQAYIGFRNKLLSNTKIDSTINPERLYESTYLKTNPIIKFTSLNSAVVESSDDHRGYIGDSQLRDAIRDNDPNHERSEVLKIAVFHHHLIPVASTDMRVAAEQTMADAAFVKQQLYKADYKIALHGHRHHGHIEQITSDQGKQLLVIGCGSSGVAIHERGEQSLQFNRISIKFSRKQIEVKVLIYRFNSSTRDWEQHNPNQSTTFLLERNLIIKKPTK